MLNKIAYFRHNRRITPVSRKQAFCLSEILLNTEKSVLTFPFPDCKLLFRNKRPLPCQGLGAISPEPNKLR
jgi:hypothetical protein